MKHQRDSQRGMERDFVMSSHREAIWVARSLVRFGEFYWSPLGPSGRTKQDFCALADGNWKEGLAVFLRGYAFERSGAPRYYSQYASEAVHAYRGDSPQHDFEEAVWEHFLLQLHGKKPNSLHNPLYPGNSGKHSVTSFVSGIEHADYNLIRWARDMLNSGQPSTAFDTLRRMRGIGEKIGAFFLRDVAGAFLMNEVSLEAAKYLQPLDIWTRRGASALAKLMKEREPVKDQELANIIVEVSQIAGVRPSLLNTGLWVFGALYAQEQEKFRQALTGPEALQRFLTEYSETYRARIGVAEEILLN